VFIKEKEFGNLSRFCAQPHRRSFYRMQVWFQYFGIRCKSRTSTRAYIPEMRSCIRCNRYWLVMTLLPAHLIGR